MISKKVEDLTADMLRACAMRCTIPLPHGKGAVKVPVDTGDWFAYPAKTEITKVYRKRCIADLRDRQLGLKLNTNEFHGDFGKCRIGGKMFTLYPKSGMLVRDDFAIWCEKHVDECWDFHLHRERLPESDTTGKAVEVDPALKMWKDIRSRALKLKPVTDLLEPGTWNRIYDMKKTLSDYSLAIHAAESEGRMYVGTKILADQLAATIAYREKHYSDCIDFFLDLSAAALKAAQFVQDVAQNGAR